MLPGRQPAIGLLLLLAVACGGDPAPSGSSPTTGPATATAPGQQTAVPDVVVRDVASGGDVNLRALALPDRPTLYWFWAPH